MLRLLAASLLLLPLSAAALTSGQAAGTDAGSAPPATVTRASHETWLRAIDSPVSAFHDKIYDWQEEQLRSPLPAPVNSDPDKLHVAVERPMRETIELEQSGDIEEGNTIGFEAYAIIPAPVATVLEAKLFTWGKPVGRAEGETWPFDSVFSRKHDTLKAKWGAGNYYCTSDTSGGGIVKNLHDDYTLLVRGSDAAGYTLTAAFFAARESSPTSSHLSIVTLKPLSGGRTEFRQTVRQQGQSYKIFGIDYGRRNFGFNAARVREGQKQFFATVNELKTTGKIRENKPGSFWLFEDQMSF